MGVCPRCSNKIYRCKKCGNIGCSLNGCANQAFRGGPGGPCLKCGSYDKELFE